MLSALYEVPVLSVCGHAPVPRTKRSRYPKQVNITIYLPAHAAHHRPTTDAPPRRRPNNAHLKRGIHRYTLHKPRQARVKTITCLPLLITVIDGLGRVRPCYYCMYVRPMCGRIRLRVVALLRSIDTATTVTILHSLIVNTSERTDCDWLAL